MALFSEMMDEASEKDRQIAGLRILLARTLPILEGAIAGRSVSMAAGDMHREVREALSGRMNAARGASELLLRARHHIHAALSLTEENRLALAVQGRALCHDIDAFTQEKA